MPIDVTELNSPGWFLSLLAAKLNARLPRLDLLDSYLRGDPPLPTGAENARDSYRAFQRKARSNFAELVVEAPRERLKVRAIHTAVDSDEDGDDEAWQIWKANGLTVEAADVHQNMLALGDAYVIVGQDEDGEPVITGEDPRQVVTMHDPVRQSRVTAALKMFTDAVAGIDYAYLYLPGRRYVAWRQTSSLTTTQDFAAGNWDWDDDRGGEFGEPLPFGRVPVVRFRNRRGVGEYEPHLDVLDRINHMLLQRMVIATMQAFRQRAAEGVPFEDESGAPIDYNDLFSADPGALWLLPEGAKLIELGQVDLTPLLSSVKDDVQHLAAVTRTPLSMVAPDSANQSAEGAALLREGLVFKVEDKQARAEQAWVDVMSLAFLIRGDDVRADRMRMSVEWVPAERYSLAEKYDAAVKGKGAGVPFRFIATEVLQATPEQVRQLAADRMDELLLAPAFTDATRAEA